MSSVFLSLFTSSHQPIYTLNTCLFCKKFSLDFLDGFGSFLCLYPKVLKELPTFAVPTSSFLIQTLTSCYLIYALKPHRNDLEDFTNNLNLESNCNVSVLILNDPSNIFKKIELKEYLCMVR